MRDICIRGVNPLSTGWNLLESENLKLYRSHMIVIFRFMSTLGSQNVRMFCFKRKEKTSLRVEVEQINNKKKSSKAE